MLAGASDADSVAPTSTYGHGDVAKEKSVEMDRGDGSKARCVIVILGVW